MTLKSRSGIQISSQDGKNEEESQFEREVVVSSRNNKL